jgi:hypothetical protein
VLKQAGGLPRDAVTRRTVDEVRAGTGSWGRKPQKDLLEGLKPGKPGRDTDGDGLPDAWETAHKLDPKDPADSAKKLPSGYTAIEEYANELAAQLVAKVKREK